MKKNILKIFKFSYFFTCFFLLFSNYAYAYIDPSTVSYLIQAVAGVGIAIGAALTIFRHKIKAAWRKWYYGRAARKNQEHMNAIKDKEEK